MSLINKLNTCFELELFKVVFLPVITIERVKRLKTK